ncbi:putative nucleic acid-binding protein, contains PIN domain [Metallosphaera yellowstonensis MK1]|uniref:Putative nucleic acid-binding protein, contains PIN domain n=2 Tax=Metallosphaera TaxID=41980 RepID=H2C2F3_9CREN|nr:putative nucleic acid-binding protein, contains PIN domain [Metallosphaera yellowstonensis MK1]
MIGQQILGRVEMKDKRFLFDASALYPLLNYVDKIDPSKIHVLSLTFYEVGNAIWKEHYLRKKVKDPIALAMFFHKFLRKFNVIEDPPLEEVIKTAVKGGLTYYDASYLYAATSLGLILVSNDKDLIGKKNTISLEDFIKSI